MPVAVPIPCDVVSPHSPVGVSCGISPLSLKLVSCRISSSDSSRCMTLTSGDLLFIRDMGGPSCYWGRPGVWFMISASSGATRWLLLMILRFEPLAIKILSWSLRVVRSLHCMRTLVSPKFGSCPVFFQCWNKAFDSLAVLNSYLCPLSLASSPRWDSPIYGRSQFTQGME